MISWLHENPALVYLSIWNRTDLMHWLAEAMLREEAWRSQVIIQQNDLLGRKGRLRRIGCIAAKISKRLLL